MRVQGEYKADEPVEQPFLRRLNNKKTPIGVYIGRPAGT